MTTKQIKAVGKDQKTSQQIVVRILEESVLKAYCPGDHIKNNEFWERIL